MKFKVILTVGLLALSFFTFAQEQAMDNQTATQADGPAVVQLDSKHDFATTVAKLKAAIEEKKMTIFAVIDHQAAAEKAGLKMQKAQLIIFGAPAAGTPLMVKDPAFALQLPLKVLVSEENGQVKVYFNDTKELIKNSRLEFKDVENSLYKAEALIKNALP